MATTLSSSIYVSASEKYITSITLCLKSLGTDWTGGRCTVYWYTVPKGTYGSYANVPSSAWVGRGYNYIYNGSIAVTQGTHNITSLTPGTTYIVRAHIIPDNASLNPINRYSEVTTYPDYPNISIHDSSITSSSAVIHLSSSGNVDKYHLKVTSTSGTTVYNSKTTSTSITVSGLSSSTEYKVEAYGIVSLSSGDYYNTSYTSATWFTTDEAGTTSSIFAEILSLEAVQTNFSEPEISIQGKIKVGTQGAYSLQLYWKKPGVNEYQKFRYETRFLYSAANAGIYTYNEYISGLDSGEYHFMLEAGGGSTYPFPILSQYYCTITIDDKILNPRITKVRYLLWEDLEIICESNIDSLGEYPSYQLYANGNLVGSDLGSGSIIWNYGRATAGPITLYVKASYSIYSEQSESIVVNIRKLDKPTELITDRRYKGLYFKWDSPSESVIRYNAKLTNRRNNKMVTMQTTSTEALFNDTTIPNAYYAGFNSLDFGTTYNIVVGVDYASVEEDMGDYILVPGGKQDSFGWDVTTLPAPPTLSLSSQDGKIHINYGVLASSGVDSFVFELFSDSSYSNASRCESITVANNNSSNLNPSGSTSFNGSYGAGTYYVRARTFYNSLGSITEDGADYVYATVTLSSTRPENWDWNASNQTLNAYNAINKVSDYTVKDFSYLVWNDFVDKVGEFLTYKKYDTAAINEEKYGFPSNTTYAQMLQYAKMNNTDVDGKFLTAKRFNIVRYCIGSMKATGLPEQSSGDTVYGHYFITLADVLNSIT